MAQIGTDILVASKLLESGEIVAIPTETVYGLAANAFDLVAVNKVFQVKNRPFFDPLILHFPNKDDAFFCFNEVPNDFHKLADAFWPGPLTLVMQKKEHIPDLITAGSDKVAVRVPNHPLTIRLLQSISFPLAAPSANPFGYVSPTNAEHVQQQLGEKTPYILDGGNCRVGLESTIIGFYENKPQIWRLGGVNIQQIEEVLGYKIELSIRKSSKPDAPGQIDKHYSTNTPLFIMDANLLLEKLNTFTMFDKIGIVHFGDSEFNYKNSAVVKNLSERKSLEEAAHNLYAVLRELDELDLEEIWATWLPNEGLGKAINDRLARAGKVL